MKIKIDEQPPPDSNDLEGWRTAVAEGRYVNHRLEDLVAAIQDLGPGSDKTVINAIAKRLSDAMFFMLRNLVARSYPNNGDDIIERVHSQVWEAILKPDSADGKGFRKAFGPRLTFRTHDALVVEARAQRLPKDTSGIKASVPKEVERNSQISTAKHEVTAEASKAKDESSFRKLTYDSEMLDVAGTQPNKDEMIESLDVEGVLELIPDEKKRLTFRLYMDGYPYKSKRSDSIERALGICEKTAREWIAEIQDLLKSKIGDKI